MNRGPLRSLALFLTQYLTQYLAVLLPGLLAAALLGSPAHALTKQEKMETCKFGAADQKLTGAKQKAFIARCMANEPSAGQRQKESRNEEIEVAETRPNRGTGDKSWEF